MAHKQPKCLRAQAAERMRSFCVFDNTDPGTRSKKAVKEAVKSSYNPDCGKTLFEVTNDELRPYIFSHSAYMTYMKQNGYFLDYCSVMHGCKTLDACEPYIEEWLERCVDDCSPSTVHTRRAALEKLYQKQIEFKAPVRKRSEVTRSRRYTKTDNHFSEKKNAELIEFCRSTGLRRFELEHMTADALIRRTDIDESNLVIVFKAKNKMPAEHIEKQGEYLLRVKGKGGRVRFVEIVGDVDLVIRKIRNTPKGILVWGQQNKNIDIHSYRRDYARRVYRRNERNLNELSVDEKYFCRNDREGDVYDRRALRITSEDLGHSRLEVVVNSYLGEEWK